MHGILFGTVLLTAFFGGMVALLAPCCVSVMLPAYLATGLGQRRRIIAATMVFAAGVATVIVPIGLGASAIVSLVSGHHFAVFMVGGLAMAIGGVAVIGGWKPRLPLPLWAPRHEGGVIATYGLGLFSGAASSCCAPVLAGVAVLSGASGSFLAALAISFTYVAGMVAPLAVMALLWDRYDWGSSQLLQGRQLTLHVAGWRRTLALGSVFAGAVLVVMGGLTVVVAFAGAGMGTGGWEVKATADLGHWSAVATQHLAWLPGWVVAVILLAAGLSFVMYVRRGRRAKGEFLSPPGNVLSRSQDSSTRAGDDPTARNTAGRSPSQTSNEAAMSHEEQLP